MPERYLDLTELSFVAGPLVLPERFSSVALNHSESYTPETIADAFLSAPGVRVIHPAEPSWNEWQARWESRERWIEIDLTACDVDPEFCGGHEVIWGGSVVTTHCLLADLLDLWNSVRKKCPGVWLHDTETLMWSPETFAAGVAAFRSRTTGPQQRPGWGTL